VTGLTSARNQSRLTFRTFARSGFYSRCPTARAHVNRLYSYSGISHVLYNYSYLVQVLYISWVICFRQPFCMHKTPILFADWFIPPS
jgi:hypothetical protein